MGFRKQRDCTIYVAKRKALISFAVTAKLIWVFVFAYAKCCFSHDEAHLNSVADETANADLSAPFLLVIDQSWFYADATHILLNKDCCEQSLIEIMFS